MLKMFSVEDLDKRLRSVYEDVEIVCPFIGFDSHPFVKNKILVKSWTDNKLCPRCGKRISPEDGILCSGCEEYHKESDNPERVYRFSIQGMVDFINTSLCPEQSPRELIAGLWKIGVLRQVNIYYARKYTQSHKDRLDSNQRNIIITHSNIRNDPEVLIFSDVFKSDDNMKINRDLFKRVIGDICLPTAQESSENPIAIRREQVSILIYNFAENIAKEAEACSDDYEQQCKLAKSMSTPSYEYLLENIREIPMFKDTKKSDIGNDIRFLNNEECTLLSEYKIPLIWSALKEKNLRKLRNFFKLDIKKGVKYA